MKREARRLQRIAIMQAMQAADIFGLPYPPQISETDLRKLYKQKLSHLHPDKPENKDKAEDAKTLGEAFLTLSQWMKSGSKPIEDKGEYVKTVKFKRMWPKLQKMLPKDWRPSMDDPFMQKYHSDAEFKNWYSHDMKYQIYKQGEDYVAYIFDYQNRDWKKYEAPASKDLRTFVKSLKPENSKHMQEFKDIVDRLQ